MGLLLAASTAPLGAMLGGALGSLYGLRTTVVIAGGGTLLAFLWVLWSPARHLRAQPDVPNEQAFAPVPLP